MNNYEELSGLRNGQWMTDSTDLAASLMACGVAPLKDGPVSNTYTKENPHRKGRPGKFYIICKQSPTRFWTLKDLL